MDQVEATVAEAGPRNVEGKTEPVKRRRREEQKKGKTKKEKEKEKEKKEKAKKEEMENEEEEDFAKPNEPKILSPGPGTSQHPAPVPAARTPHADGSVWVLRAAPANQWHVRPVSARPGRR